jgi:RNA polymerase-binding transcription factor DksA
MSTQEVDATAVVALPRQRERSLAGAPRWRALLERRWKDQLQEVTQLSLEFHEAGIAVQERRPLATSLQQLRRRAVIARRRLADLDDALDRLAAGQYGQCESCAGTIPPELLAQVPEDRYCPQCA